MSDDLTYAALGITQAVGLFTTLCPKVYDVRRAWPGDGIADDVRTAELVAGGLAITLATVSAMHHGSAKPLVYTALGIALMTGTYEYLMRTPRLGLEFSRNELT